MKRLMIAATAALTLLLAGCASTIRSNVTTFHQWPDQLPDKTYAFEAPPAQDEAAKVGVRAAFVFTPPNGSVLAEIGMLADAGKLRPVIGMVLPLADVRQAHEIGEAGGVTGKIVLNVG
mgnify:CR=1 FL=1